MRIHFPSLGFISQRKFAFGFLRDLLFQVLHDDFFGPVGESGKVAMLFDRWMLLIFSDSYQYF